MSLSPTTRILASINRFRGSRFHVPAEATNLPAKEWYHFCVFAGGMDLIVNFSICDDTRPAASDSQIGRVIVLLHDQRWLGAVETVEAKKTQATPGLIDLELGDSRLGFDGVFRVRVRLPRHELDLDLVLSPVAAPLRSLGTPIGDGKLNWVVVPSLRARGRLRVHGRLHQVEDAPAYHDHNWGHWQWGADFAWQWGYALPDDPDERWSLVYSRMSDRGHTRDHDRKLYLWRDDLLARLFCKEEIAVRAHGSFPRRPIRRFPPVMSLVVSGNGADVPARLELEAGLDADRLRVVFHAEDLTQVAIPNETDLRTTLINEVSGRLEIDGTLDGSAFHSRGRGIFEFLGVA